jgi:hypothetical protein
MQLKWRAKSIMVLDDGTLKVDLDDQVEPLDDEAKALTPAELRAIVSDSGRRARAREALREEYRRTHRL